jgi:hypothetical protein
VTTLRNVLLCVRRPASIQDKALSLMCLPDTVDPRGPKGK